MSEETNNGNEELLAVGLMFSVCALPRIVLMLACFGVESSLSFTIGLATKTGLSVEIFSLVLGVILCSIIAFCLYVIFLIAQDRLPNTKRGLTKKISQ